MARTSKNRPPSECPVMRRKLVRSYTFDLVTGERKSTGEEWVTEPCGVPLFERAQIGKCKACAEGWTHPENYPVEA